MAKMIYKGLVTLFSKISMGYTPLLANAHVANRRSETSTNQCYSKKLPSRELSGMVNPMSSRLAIALVVVVSDLLNSV